MASVTKEFLIRANPESVWDAIRDFHAVHRRVAPGFLVHAERDGNDRVLTFFNGMIARERLVACDDVRWRLSYTIVEGRFDHHHASVQVFPHETGSRVVWITDLLPDALADTSSNMMDRGSQVMQQTLEGSAPGSAG
jgi:hypothetical protein